MLIKLTPNFVGEKGWHRHNFMPTFIGAGGIWFWYNGDEVCWCWPWDRRPYKYVSLLCEGCFKSLKEIDDFYEEASRYGY